MNASGDLLAQASDVEVFQELTEGNGGRVPWALLPSGNAQWFGVCLERARRYVAAASRAYPKLPPVYCDFSHNPGVNAYAYPFYKGRHVIEVFAGAPLVLAALFRRMLAEPSVLLHVRDSAAEQTGLPRFVGFRPNAEKLAEFGLPSVGPISPERVEYAYHLTRIALDYLAGHEIGHVVHGHTDYADTELHLSAVMELGWRPPSAKVSIILQTLEMDADCWAVSNALGLIRKQFTGENSESPWRDRYYRDADRAFFDWAFAMHTYFRMFGHPPFKGQNLEAISHPPDTLRAVMALAAGERYILSKWDAAILPTYRAAVWRAIIEAERAFSAVTDEAAGAEGMRDAGSPDAEAHVGRLVACWKKTVRPQLLDYSYTDRLPA